MFHWTITTGLENLQDSILLEIETALVPITATAWEAAQHFSYGARVLFARPSERSERLKLFVIISFLYLISVTQLFFLFD
jgi:hypothetical protein